MSKKTFIINDLHLGVRRQSGTTNASREALTDWMYGEFELLLAAADGHNLLILGDLFDGHQVSKRDEHRVFRLLCDWAQRDSLNELTLVAGNHDLSRDSQDISSFENLCAYLKEVGAVTDSVIQESSCLSDGPEVVIIPHMPNQALFDAELERWLKFDGLKYLLLHCNFDNHFAKESDHSLNVSAEVAEQFATKGVQLIFAHEHQQRDLGNVHVIGNQIPSSIADCKGNSSKRFAVLSDEGLAYQDFLRIEDVYAEVDWRSDTVPNKRFIRVTGSANYDEAAAVVQRIADIRQQSTAFVVANAIRVGALETTFDTAEDLKSFDVRQMVQDELPAALAERFAEVVEYGSA